MRMRTWAVLLVVLAGCQAEVAGQEPQLPNMPPGKDDSPVGDPTAADPEEPACAGEDCEAEPRELGPSEGTEREPNDDPVTATAVGVPVAVVHGELGSGGDHDWFLVRIVERGGYVFETSTGDLADDQATDTLVRVYDAEEPDEPIASDDDSGEGFASRAAVSLSPGQVLVEVSGYGGGISGAYTLEVRGPEELPELEAEPEPVEEAPIVPAAQADESEANDSVDTADSMGEAPDSIGAELEAGGVDNFVFAAAAAGSVTIETGPREEGGRTVDTVVELYTADGVTMIGSDDDSADDPLWSRLTIDLPAAGVYFLRVRGYSDSAEGGYRAFFVR